jgi:hypothetical protein
MVSECGVREQPQHRLQGVREWYMFVLPCGASEYQSSIEHSTTPYAVIFHLFETWCKGVEMSF